MARPEQVLKDYDSKDDMLWEWVTNSDHGVMGFEFGNIPAECIDFCVEQFSRFNVPLPAALHDVLVSGASAAFYFVDSIDPYALFKGVSDVDFTFDWRTHAYEVACADGSSITREANPEHLETYRAVPGQAEAMFAHMLARPGLKALPFFIGEQLEEVLEGRGDECWDAIDAEAESALRQICTPEGAVEPDKGRMLAYFELSAWAAFVWLAGPLGRGYRATHHELMSCAMEYGECILLDWTIIPPTYYTKHDRPPESCHRCGTQAWCVEHTQSMGHGAYICEACLNFDMPKYGFANCGTKFCKDSFCPNHPFAQQGAAGAFSSMQKAGQLMSMAREGSGLRLHGVRDGQLTLS